MRVLLVNKFHYRKGGSETYYFALAEGLRSLGHEVFFFAMEDSKNEPCDQEKYFVSSRDYNGPTSLGQKVSAATSLVYSAEARRKFQALCEEIEPDIIHMNLVHRQITLSILDAPYLKQYKVPVVWTAHDYIAVCPNYTMLDGSGNICEACVGGRFASCMKKKCIKGSTAKSGLGTLEAAFLRSTAAYSKINRIICPSQFLMGKMVEGGFKLKQLIWMPNFLTDATVEETREASMSRGEPPYFIYFGRLAKEKGVEVLLRAYSKALDHCAVKYRLFIVGEGPIRKDLESLSAKLGISGCVDFLGYKSGIELRSLVKGARFSIVPSTWYENMPFSVVESLVAGTPVLGSRIGGIPEMISDGVTGFTFAAGDVQDLANLIDEAAGLDESAYRSMQQAGMDFVSEHCSQDKYMKRLVDIYTHLIEEQED